MKSREKNVYLDKASVFLTGLLFSSRCILVLQPLLPALMRCSIKNGLEVVSTFSHEMNANDGICFVLQHPLSKIYAINS